MASRDAILADVRDVRFADGVHCPRCGSGRVKRHGTFDGRYRYKCRECRRTFSDLTGTPIAYSKYVTRWPAYCRCFAASLSVRRAAAVVAVHPSTSFRWRHLLLDEARSRDDQVLNGRVELDLLWFAYSEKGRRRGHTGRDGTRRPDERGREKGVDVVVAYEEERGVVVTALAPERSSGAGIPSWKLESALEGRLGPGVTLATAARVLVGPARLVARRLRLPFDDRVPGPALDFARAGPASPLRGARGYGARFRSWLWQFRGVATRYLSNYLIWHRWLDGVPPSVVAARAMRWPVGAAYG